MTKWRFRSAILLVAVTNSTMASAGNVYYGSYFAVYDLEIPATYDVAKQCILKQAYDNKLGFGWVNPGKKGVPPIFAGPENIVSRWSNVKGRQIETIEFGKHIGLKIEVEKGEGVTRFVLRGIGVSQGALGEGHGKYITIFQPCFDLSQGAASPSMKDPLRLAEVDRNLSFHSDLRPAEIVRCLENFPNNVHYSLYLSNVTPQVTYNADGSFLVRWRNSGSMLSGPRFIYSNVHYVETINGKTRLSIGHMAVGGRIEERTADYVSKSWYAELAQSCAKDGTSKKILPA